MRTRLRPAIAHAVTRAALICAPPICGAPWTSAAAQPSPSAGAPLADSTRIALNRVFATWSGTDRPGCTLGIGGAGQPGYANGYGMANLELDAPNTPGSVFHAASVSKQFTAMAVLLLARDGKLSLDDDVRRHLPELPDYGHRITIRHLLTHTSGLRDQWDLLFMARGRFEENRITEADVLDVVTRQRALNFVPGTEYLYSNTGFTLAGTIVRRVSGQSLRAFADERIFRPLGMSHTHFHDDYTMVVRDRAAGYARGDDGQWHVSLPNFDTYGATSLFTTVGDLLTWEANLAAPTVGDETLVRAMRTSATLAGGDSTGYGLGLATEVYRGATLVGHGGAHAGYRAYVGRFPDHGLAIAVLCNAASANPAALARGVADVLLAGRLDPVPAVAARFTPSREQLGRVAGVYAHPTTGAPTFVTLRGDTLILGQGSGPALLPLAERRFRVAGQPVELELAADGALVQTTLGWPRRTPLRLAREEPARSSPAALRALAGRYTSAELGATYTVAATDSTLTLRVPGGELLTVRPAYGSTFVGDMQVTFTSSGGRLDGLLLSSGRVRRVRLDRVAR